MKKSAIALALTLTMAGSLAACSSKDAKSNTSGSTGSAGSGATSGQVARRYGGGMNDYVDDGRYTAGTDGRVYGGDGNNLSRDLTRDARDIVRDAGDAIGDVGRGIGNAARDITRGMGGTAPSRTPSWEPDSSAIRY